MSTPSVSVSELFLLRRRSDSKIKPLCDPKHDFESRFALETILSKPMKKKQEQKKSNVLVADDVRVNRLLLKRSLEKLGHDVKLANDGKEALDLLFEDDFDLVLLDMYMPEFNGDEVLRVMMGSKRLQHIPVIMVSANDEMKNVAKCIDMGAADYLSKPFDQSLFKARVNSCLKWNRKTFNRIEQEKNRADHLLSVIYPEVVVKELKTTHEVRPRRHDDVAVLFLDIVGFTSYCRHRTPEEVVNLLHRVFCVFEDIADKHGVDKTKTIGDAFMVSIDSILLFQYYVIPLHGIHFLYSHV